MDFINVFKTLNQLNYRGAFLIEMWTEKAEEPVAEIVQARRWIEQRMQQGGSPPNLTLATLRHWRGNE